MKKIYNIIQKHKKRILIILSFLIPLITYLIIFYINGLLTNKTIISGDMYVQYYPLFNYLKGIYNGTNSIFYSFSKGLGGTMFGTFFYYLSSPLNLLLFFIDKQHIPDFMTYLIILKLSLCGLTMYLYMHRKFKSDSLLLLTFSTCYAFMGYNLNYFINIMWLDVVFMTPLVLIGLDRIIENKSPLFYIITLFISILANYYISYMLCIFCVLYFIYEVLLRYNKKRDKKNLKKILKKFIISSLLTGLMCSFFIIPCIYEILNYERNVELSEIFVLNYNYFDLFSKTYFGTLELNDPLNCSSINIYCGIIVLPLVYLFIINKTIEKKERILTLLVIIFMILPYFILIFNYIWHLFTIPMFYNYRYSYLLCLFMIIIAYKSITNLQISMKKILFYLALYLIISLYSIIITCYENYSSFLNYKLIWITLFILIVYVILLSNIKRKYIKRILIVIIISEQFLNIYIVFKKFDPLNKNILYSNQIEKIMKKYNKIGYRIENINNNTFNDSMIYQYNGISSFLSTTNQRTLNFEYLYVTNKIDESNFYFHHSQNYMLESILGVKYIISNEKMDKYNLIEDLNIDEKKYYIYENPNSIGYGLIVKNRCNNIKNSVIYSQDLFNCLLNSNYDLYKEYKNINNEYIINKGNYYYIFMDEINESNFEKLNKHIKGDLYYKAPNYYIYIKNNDRVKFIFDEKMNKKTFKVMYFDYKLFSTIKYQTLQIEDINEQRITGKINAKEAGILMITLPYEYGFDIYIDNKKTDYFEVASAFIGVDLEAGIHNIKIEYKQPKYKEGCIISLFSLLSCIIYIFNDRKKK